MIRKIKGWIARRFASFLYIIYREEIKLVMAKANKEQLAEVHNMIIETLESGLELNIILNPDMMYGMGMYLEEYEEGYEERVNPFKLVKDDEE